MQDMSLLLWQLIDSGFPAGGFAHSGGLEASLHHGEVTDGDAVLRFAQRALAQAGRSALPIVTAAHQTPSRLPELDGLSDVFLSSPVANRASRAQGRAFVTSVARSFPHAPLEPLVARLRDKGFHGHYAPAFGAVLSTLEVDLPETQRALLFMTTRAIASAAVRLGLIGAYEAQELQTLLEPQIERTLARCGALGPADIAHTAPLIDLYQSTHDRLYSRLFQS
jgi:urease accessory protein